MRPTQAFWGSGSICEAAFPAGLTNSAGREPVAPVAINMQPLTGLMVGCCSIHRLQPVAPALSIGDHARDCG
jgi:hypothetical protein